MPTDARQHRRHQSHARILDAAAQALLRGGVAGVGVADVMRQAGLTHGGFYAHFASREALLAAALEHAGRQGMERIRERMRQRMAEGATPLRALVEEYLSDAHACADGAGCPVAALASDMTRCADPLRDASARSVHALVALARQALPPGMQSGAAAVAAALSGALQMARVLGQDGGGPALLSDCRAALLLQYEGATPAS
ncbi:TetR/AcrR family transcriptional regulator [uncultured Massilia sp.]|uniref:TetR/AcrR family transcriptional regulator n=1 Tax=uncultured Massilia sp. TaxID=169973 RepID=UPI0025F5F5F3|nr:TetR/AcrR family transcriptional regulator [uncultured Massilia sp.]